MRSIFGHGLVCFSQLDQSRRLQTRMDRMVRQTSSGGRPARSKTEDDRVSTREHLLEAAGHVFAKKGFERSTAKEICERAGTNTAAVNYHFGGIEALYAAVLDEARSRILSVRAIARQSKVKATRELSSRRP